jgi:hypothetical protein
MKNGVAGSKIGAFSRKTALLSLVSRISSLDQCLYLFEFFMAGVTHDLEQSHFRR